MHIFYDPQIGKQGIDDLFSLNAEESRHCVKVLRLAEGHVLHVVNGRGGSYTCEIHKADPRATVLKLLSAEEEYQKRNHYLHIAVAPTKNIERLEWFLEKATEMGIDEVTPVICERSERREVKTERLVKVMIAAMKQSLKAYLPKLNEPIKLSQFFKTDQQGSQQFIAHCAEGTKSFISGSAPVHSGYTVLIGPEGDFSDAEITRAIKDGYQPVSLGQSRLRTETAALAACFEINYLNRK